MEALINFLQQYWQFFALVGGVVLAIVVTAGLIGRHGHKPLPVRPVKPEPVPEPIAEEPHIAPEPDAPALEPAPAVPVADVPVPPSPAPADPSSSPAVPTAPAVPTVPAETPAEAKPAAESPAAVAPAPVANAEPVPAPAQEPAPVAKPEPKPKEPKPELGAYHVLYRPEDGKWVVKRDGSPKIMRTLETQTDAVNWTTIKALTQDVEMIVHKKDGSVKPVPQKSSK